MIPIDPNMDYNLIMWRRLLQIIVRIIFRGFTRVCITGLSNIPQHGGGLICVNHLALSDAGLVFAMLERQDVTALVASKHKENPILRLLVKLARGIWLNREEADSQAIRAAIQYIQNGGLLGIAPEGTRSKSGGMQPGKPGVAYLAFKVNAPIYPVALTGAERAWQELRRLRRPVLTMKVGKPFVLPPVERKTREADLQRNTDEIMCRIASLLPQSYRGVYADHPRVKELELEGYGV